MHELSITQSLVDTVSERVGDRHVERVTLVIGRLSGVVADSVQFCFELCTSGTPLDGAVLDIVEPPGEGRCRSCGAEVGLADFLSLCPCGSADIEVTSGQQLTIREVEVAA